MKTLKTDVKWKGVKKAVGDTRRCPHFWRVYADFSNGTVWVNEYVSKNSWTSYKSASISEIASGHGYNSIFGQTAITIAELRQLLEQE